MQCFRVLISLILAVIFLISYPSQAVGNGNKFFQKLASIFLPQKHLGAPESRSTGSSGRGECSVIASSSNNEIEQASLIALIPPIRNLPNENETENLPDSFEMIWGKTFKKHPSFWFYIPFPYKESELEYGKFVILNQDKSKAQKPIYFQLRNDDNRNLNNKPIIGKLTLPPDVKGLEPDKQYNWYFSILCDERKPSRNPTVSGWVEREGKESSSPKDYLDYIESEILYDGVTDLINRIDKKSTTPPKPQTENDWEAFLEYILSPTNSNEDSTDKINNQLIKEIKNAPIVELKPVEEEDVQNSGFEV